MKLSVGEFPRHHHFILIARPFVEWSFKVIGWLVVTATIQYAAQKTGSASLVVLKWFCYMLLLLFNGSFVDWILSFQRLQKPQLESAKLQRSANLNWIQCYVSKARGALALLLGLLLTLILLGLSNVASEAIILSLAEFQTHK